MENSNSLALISYVQKSPLNTNADVSKGARRLHGDLRLYLQLYFVYASSEGSDESAHMRRLIRAFVARHDKVQNEHVLAQNFTAYHQNVDMFLCHLNLFSAAVKGHIWLTVLTDLGKMFR